MKSKIHELKLIKKIGVPNINSFLFPKSEQSIPIIFLLMLFSFGLLFIRISITKTLYYLFLVWNVFLAIIPYVITMYLSETKKTYKISFFFIFAIWLAFLPNAPYIITDLFHLSKSSFKNIWIDTLVISAFAITGMLLFYFSLFQMKRALLDFFNQKIAKTLIITTIYLSAFGVYIGRFLRYNSWEILSDPLQLFRAIFDMVLHPTTNKEVWLFTVSFGLFLQLGYSIFKRLNTKNQNNTFN
ncbi:DUF1361 domain-containing protein [Lacinutrix jangbogonensis]|uniref:DUF1361 domain-containing protein n=1 Tax=Lacinutrix jangbogonensis TaxID=1469557 RepID=UPI00068B98B1|nr:DUF1361 domain-containing protein [Lacinutrix jangbogonensis]